MPDNRQVRRAPVVGHVQRVHICGQKLAAVPGHIGRPDAEIRQLIGRVIAHPHDDRGVPAQVRPCGLLVHVDRIRIVKRPSGNAGRHFGNDHRGVVRSVRVTDRDSRGALTAERLRLIPEQIDGSQIAVLVLSEAVLGETVLYATSIVVAQDIPCRRTVEFAMGEHFFVRDVVIGRG